jgi:cholesterol transport system auxiliary component|tara:strand:+ start:136218 stop:136835 length:618 start_codon:yes stop_codon:yes gene_type:complete
MMRAVRCLPVILAAGIATASCGPLVQLGGNNPVPDSLLTLATTAPTVAEPTGAPVLITLPDVPGKLRTTRVAVVTTNNEIQYLPAAGWIEQPNILFQRVLLDTFEARTSRPALDERSIDIVPAARLSGNLAAFELDVRGAPQVRVGYNATLTTPDAGLIATRRFEVVEPVSVETGPAVAAALTVAANRIAVEISDWAGAATSTAP